MPLRKYIRATFKNGAIYDFSVEEMIRLYAKMVMKEALDTSIEHAISEAKRQLEDNPEALIEFMSNGLSWKDVVLDANAVVKALGNKDAEWPACKKEYLER
jgi:hypothetical protein